jgi:hypothetical protein
MPPLSRPCFALTRRKTAFRLYHAGYLLALLPLTSSAATLTVGNASFCNFATIQAAITAAAAAPGPDLILISRNQTWTAQELLINSQDLTISSGAACGDLPDGLRATISGAGGAALPVLRINTSGSAVVTLRFLNITGGLVTGDNLGGGILYNGSVNSKLVIEDSVISNNEAAYGGGIYVNGNGSRGKLEIGANVLVASNDARISGGGIYLSNADLKMDAPNSAIAFNDAGDFGGGLRALGPSDISIKSGGQGLGTVYANTARIGGGIALQGSPDVIGIVNLRIETMNPLNVVRIRANAARERGGAIYSRTELITGFGGGTSSAVAELNGTNIEENFALIGAAIYLDYSASLTDTEGAILIMGPAPGCAGSAVCNQVSGNQAQTVGGMPTTGGIVVGADTSFIGMYGTQLIGNSGGPPVYSDSPSETPGSSSVQLTNVVIANNEVRGDAIVRVVRGVSTSIFDTTITNNTLTGNAIINVAGSIRLEDSIFWQPGKITLNSGSALVSRVLASETASLPNPLLAINADPRFIDPANGNFRLKAGSRAIDVAPPITGDDRDADGLPRDQDLDLIANVAGPRDLGAFERQTLLPLVQNAGFASDVRLWPEVVNNVSQFQSDDAVAGAGGSLRVTETGGSIAALQARRQCVHLPGPSTYRLNGFGRGYSTQLFRDTLSLLWRLRPNSADCSGGVIREGALVLPNGTIWASAAQSAIIPISSAEWTVNSTLEIVLLATDERVLPPNNIDVAFDEITLEPGQLPNGIFANGFEQ